LIAYYCNKGNEELATLPTYSPGDVLQVCIRIDDALKGEEIFVTDIVSFVLSQRGDPALAAAPTTAIQNRQTDHLTLKDCDAGDGRCNVKHQLTSTFFDDPSPGDLEVSGVALISFGTPGGGRKLIRVPVRGLFRAAAAGEDTAARQLQSPSGAESEFGLTANLAPALLPTVTDETNNDQADNSHMIIIAVAVVDDIVCIALCAMVVCFFLCVRRRDDQENLSSRANSHKLQFIINGLRPPKYSSSRSSLLR
jgi:hypothetical protein